jgi:DNA replication protein DnaC
MPVDDRIINIRLGEFGIPAQLRNLRLDKKTPKICHDFVDRLPDHYVTSQRPLDKYPADRSTIGRGLIWAGPRVAGKTHQALQTLQECYFRYWVDVYFTPFERYTRVTKDQYGLDNKETTQEEEWWHNRVLIERTRESPVLLLDDIPQRLTDFEKKELDSLLRYRHLAATPTLITTNVVPQDWEVEWGPSVSNVLSRSVRPVE